MSRRFTIPTSAALLLTLAACGGGGTSPNPPGPPPPPPPPPPAPVASVVVSPSTASLVPTQTQTLTAATKDAAGNDLAGRTITWASSANTVASVSTSGLVTAVGPGSATISATSEGQSGSAVITVADGGQVTAGGGTVTAGGGAVQIVIPPGAVSGPVSVTVTPNANPPALPDLRATPATLIALGGTSYTFGPAGTTFTAPVTVKVKYDPAKMPTWVTPSDMVLIHHNGTAWERLPGQAVDPVARTVTATTTSFSPFLIAAGLPPVTLTPAVGAVNRHQISAQFDAVIPGHPSTTGLRYVWKTTGANGGVGGLFQNQGQYTWTNFNAAPGTLDVVTVEVWGTVDPTVGEVMLSSAQASVDQSLQFTYEVNPDLNEVPFGGTQTLDAQIRDANGGIYTPPSGLATRLVWTSSSLTGKLDIANPNHQTNATRGVYTASVANLAPPKAPRIDQITVDFYPGYLKTFSHQEPSYTIPLINVTIPGALVIDSTGPRWDLKRGTNDAFVEVAPKIDVASFTVRTTPSGGGSCVAAVANVAKRPGVTSYKLDVTGIVGGSAFEAAGYHRTITGPTNTGSFMDIFDGGTFYGVPMDGGCASLPSSIKFRQDLYAMQYGKATFLVTVP